MPLIHPPPAEVIGPSSDRSPAPLPSAALPALVSRALGVDRAIGRRVLRASLAANVRFQRDYDRLARRMADPHRGPSARRPAEAAPALDWPAAAVWSRALEADGRPLLLATLHLGCYLSALLALADHLRWLGRITVIRRQRDGPREHDAQLHFERLGLEVAVVRTRDHPARAALRALRRGEHALLLFDVPPSFDTGRTVAVPFFGRPAHMASGPAQLAAHAGALLWPFAMPMIDGRLRMRTREPLVPDSRASCRAATHALARFAEDCILETPEQWLLWAQLPALWGVSPAPLPSAEQGRADPGRS